MKYRVYATVTGSKYLGIFEADYAEQAEEMALESDECYISVCHHCAKDISDPEITEVEAVKAGDTQ